MYIYNFKILEVLKTMYYTSKAAKQAFPRANILVSAGQRMCIKISLGVRLIESFS